MLYSWCPPQAAISPMEPFVSTLTYEVRGDIDGRPVLLFLEGTSSRSVYWTVKELCPLMRISSLTVAPEWDE